MNSEIVIWNECINDNRKIHLYWDEKIGMWCAFGISAFGIVVWLKENNTEDNSHYSEEMCMPVTLLSMDRLMRMAQNAADIEEMTGTYVCLKMAREVDLEIYSAWAGHLRN